MRKISNTFIILFFSTCISACGGTIEKDRFNLMFNCSDSLDSSWWSSISPVKPKVDSSEFIGSKHPIYYEADEHSIHGIYLFYHLKINLFQTFVVPPSFCAGKEVEIVIHNKSIGMSSLKLKIIGVDTLGNVVKTDSIDINSNGKWNKECAKIYFDDIQLFTVAIIGDGTLEFPVGKREIPRVYLDRISITIDGKSINQINEINQFSDWDNEILHREDVYPLNKEKISGEFLKEIGLDKKRVIALGESVHGSKEINETVFQIAKTAIMNNNCKLILSELSLPVSMKINLFIKGQLAENEITNIREELSENHICLPAFIEFLSWLREYNKTVEKKVVFLGLMDTSEFIVSPLYGYIFAFYNNENKNILLPLLEKLHRSKLKEAFDFATDNSEKLKQILDKEEFFLFMHALGNLSKNETGEMQLNLDNYDYYMWLNAKTLISECLKGDESVLIYAHYGHVRKNGAFRYGDPSKTPMGVYLNNYYNEDYGVIGLTVGQGRITSRELTSGKFTIIDLEETNSGSIEKICLQQNSNFFYYPSKKMLYNIYSIRYIGSGVAPFSKKETFTSLKANVDGFIFIRNSNNFNDNYPYSDNYFWNRGIERAAFLKKNFHP